MKNNKTYCLNDKMKTEIKMFNISSEGSLKEWLFKFIKYLKEVKK